MLLGHASAIESRLRAAEADFRAYAAGTTGSLRVGIYQSVANKILPELMRRFTERWPSVDVQVTEGTRDDELVEAVERGELDLTFAIEPIAEGPFEVQQLMRDPYVLVVSARSSLARRRPSVRDLDGLPMVGYPHGNHQDIAEEFLRGRGVRPHFVFRSYDNGTVQAMVASGLGLALAPLLAVDEKEPATRLTQLVEAVPPRILVVVWHRDRFRPPSAAAFVDTAVAVAGEIERAQSALLARTVSSLAGRRRSTAGRTRAPGHRPRRSASRSA